MMFSRAWPIIKREYMTRITTKGFWISTALLPLLTIGMSLMPLLTSRTKSSVEPVRIVDGVGDFYPLFEDSLRHANRNEEEEPLPPVTVETPGSRSLDEVRRDLNDLADKGEIQGYFVIDSESIEADEIVFYARNPSSAIGQQRLSTVLANAIRIYRVRQLGFEGEGIQRAIESIGFDIMKASNDPRKRDQSGTAAFLTSFGLVLFIYFSLIFYGVHVLRGVLEEKMSRIVEVIVSTTRPFDLMLGKIFGIGAVGMTQVLIWVVFGTLISIPQVGAFVALSGQSMPALSASSLAFFPVFFVLGFFLYATIYAGIGSMFNSEEDAQQMTSVATMMLVIPLMVMTPVIKNPSGGLAVGLSLFPFFAPILMYLRICVEMPPLWQIGASIAIMVATIFLMIWLVGKVYRVGILMYGKKPTIPEIMRWLRYT